MKLVSASIPSIRESALEAISLSILSMLLFFSSTATSTSSLRAAALYFEAGKISVKIVDVKPRLAPQPLIEVEVEVDNRGTAGLRRKRHRV